MSLELIPVKPDQAPELARIIFDAFHAINARHNFPDDIPDLATATMLTNLLTTRPDFYGVAATLEGKIVGCNFAQLSDPVAGVGPICVDPAAQARGIGKQLMTHVVQH